jgi:type II secretory pathway predicted ATPase ExeA
MKEQRVRLQSYFGFTKMPFTKYMWATKMFEASCQQELLQGLHFWLETRGIALLYGPAGVGKSITLRRFKADIDQRRFDIFYLFNLRTTPIGFMRSLSRLLALPVLYQQADLFDSLSAFLGHHEERTRKHPIIIFDDGDGLSDQLLELLRLLANFAMDSEDRFSFILSGSPKLAARIRSHQNEPLKQRIGFSHNLRGFTVDDARAYVQFHLDRAEGPAELFTDDAVQIIFNLAKGLPRVINQMALQALIRAAIRQIESIDEKFLKQHVLNNSLFDAKLDEQ